MPSVKSMEETLKDFTQRREGGEDFGFRDLQMLGTKIERARLLEARAKRALEEAQDFAREILNISRPSR